MIEETINKYNLSKENKDSYLKLRSDYNDNKNGMYFILYQPILLIIK